MKNIYDVIIMFFDFIAMAINVLKSTYIPDTGVSIFQVMLMFFILSFSFRLFGRNVSFSSSKGQVYTSSSNIIGKSKEKYNKFKKNHGSYVIHDSSTMKSKRRFY